jgi:hypothetical protein
MPKGQYNPTTREDLEFIKENYLAMGFKTIGRHLGWSGSRVKKHIAKLGLHVPQEIVMRNRLQSQFRKGQVPHSKGKKQSEFMTPEGIERSKKTRFQPGVAPHNTLFDGAISIRKSKGRPYVWIRLSQGEWELLHRVIWMAHHGEIPEDKIVAFRDGDSLNIELDNLELSCRKENMLRNSKWELDPEIIPSKVLILKIQETIKKLEHGKK